LNPYHFTSFLTSCIPKNFTKINTRQLYINRNIAIDMGATKTEIFTQQQNHLAMLFKALAHPARIAILQHMMAANSCICGDLVTELGLAQATISQHLKELKNAGLIKGTIEGVSVCYCIDPVAWGLLHNQLSKFVSEFNSDAGGDGACCN
jgi:predicted transcriptional regulator